MLRELFVDNFALVERARVPFGPGFNVLTGETGAGKSLVLDALGAAVGHRVSPEMVRRGASTARVEAAFEIDEGSALGRRLDSLGFPPEDGLLVLAREVVAGGRGRSRINGRLVSTAELAQVGSLLVDIHTQHESQRLMQPAVQLELLDAFAGEAASALAREVGDAWQAMDRLAAELQALRTGERQRLQELDLLRFQVEEIQAARLQPGEEPAWMEEHARLTHAARLQELLGLALDLLGGSGTEQTSALSTLAAAGRALDEAASLAPALGSLAQELAAQIDALSELGRAVRRYLEQCEPDPERLAEVEARLALLERLKRKYGPTVEAVMAYGEEARARLESLQGASDRLAVVEQELAQARARYEEAARQLGARRREAAQRVAGAIEAELRQLAMPRASFSVAVEPQPPGPSGTERVIFQFSANPGEPPRPLARIASGGELSRTMLACRTVLAEADPVPVLVFDEPDAGLGGRAAQAVAERLARIARQRQVLVVTHLPQVASMADHHLAVRKHEEERTTRIEIEALGHDQRVAELARMLGGTDITETARRHASELLRMAGEAKRAS
ncbi:MAG: DNA repair protein RecN [Firmicutes bacterium]|nr:DNA repair protein RecN [Bacillota bacterium]